MTSMNMPLMKVLRDLGVPEDKAEKAAEYSLTTEHLATKADLAELKTELKADLAELKTELKADLAELKADMTRLELKLVGWILGAQALAIAVLNFLLK